MFDSILTILPLFALIALGFVAKKTVLDGAMLPALNQFVYYFAVPALLFNSAREQSIDELANIPALSAFFLGISATALVSVLGSRWLFSCHRGESLIMRGQTSVFSNLAYMGIPLTFGLFGDEAHAPTISILLLGNLLLISGTQLLIESFRSEGTSPGHLIKLLDRSLLRSPMFMSMTLGLVFSAYNLDLPDVANNTLQMLSPAAVPVALFCLGASLEFKRTNTRNAEIAWIIVMKLIVHPALTLGAFILLGVEDRNWLVVGVLLASLPTGALAHVLAMRYDLFEKESSQIVVFSTVLSTITVMTWTTLLVTH